MKKLSEKECLEVGGHCWNHYSANDVLDKFGNQTGLCKSVYYPDGEPQYRTCKHCGKREKQIPSNWIDCTKHNHNELGNFQGNISKQQALKVVLDYVERWNKHDREPDVAEAARILEEE